MAFWWIVQLTGPKVHDKKSLVQQYARKRGREDMGYSYAVDNWVREACEVFLLVLPLRVSAFVHHSAMQLSHLLALVFSFFKKRKRRKGKRTSVKISRF